MARLSLAKPGGQRAGSTAFTTHRRAAELGRLVSFQF